MFQEQTETNQNLGLDGVSTGQKAIESFNSITTDLRKDVQSIKGLLLSP